MVTATKTQTPQVDLDVSEDLAKELLDYLAPQLLDARYDQYRQTQFPYGIIANQNPAGLFIPLDQLEAIEWKNIPSEDKLDTYTPNDEEIKGILLKEVRALIFFISPEYVIERLRKKGENGVLGLYEDAKVKTAFNKKAHSRCEDYYMVILDEDNVPQHNPHKILKIRFSNVSRVNMSIALREFYTAAEALFNRLFRSSLKGDRRLSGKSDEWRSFLVAEIQFKAEKEGEEGKRNWCCKIANITRLTAGNFKRLYLGDPKNFAMISELYNSKVAGLGEGYTPAALLPASPTQSVEIIPPKGVTTNGNNDFFEQDDTLDSEIDLVELQELA